MPQYIQVPITYRRQCCFNCLVLPDEDHILKCVFQLWLADDCWLQANLYLGIHQDFDLEDQRPYCFSVMVGHGKSHYFNVELGSELAVWEKSFQRAIFLEVQRTGVSSEQFKLFNL